MEGLEGHTILHAGPPIEWERMCGAMRGSVIGLVLWEGWATTPQEAERLMGDGKVRLEPNHHHHGVGPMAGTTSPSLPVWVVENRTSGNRAYCRLAEGFQQFGQFDAEALGGLVRWRDVWAPSIRAGLRKLGPIPLKSIIARALQMGDELHNRPNAASSLFANVMGQAMVDADVPKQALLQTMGYLSGNEFLFLGISMAAAKSAVEPLEGIEDSTLVTAMARNGVEFGIRVSGMPGQWFVAPAPAVDGLFLPGFNRADAGLDMGDSAITETVGWGGFVLGGAPGILALTGGTPEEALRISRDMRDITAGLSPDYQIAGTWVCRHRGGHRHSEGGRDRHRTGDRHRDRASRTRSPQDRRRPGESAHGLLPEGTRGVRPSTRRDERHRLFRAAQHLPRLGLPDARCQGAGGVRRRQERGCAHGHTGTTRGC